MDEAVTIECPVCRVPVAPSAEATAWSNNGRVTAVRTSCVVLRAVAYGQIVEVGGQVACLPRHDCGHGGANDHAGAKQARCAGSGP